MTDSTFFKTDTYQPERRAYVSVFFMLLSFLPLGIAALLCSFFLTPVSGKLAVLLGAIDRPDGGRHRHRLPTPRLGGAAFAASFLLALPLLIRFSPERENSLYFALTIGGILCLAFGISDDMFSLSAGKKLFCQILTAGIPVFWLSPLAMAGLPWKCLALFFLVTLMNAQNFVDGSDGLAAVLSITGCIGLCGLAVLHGKTSVALAAFLLICAVVGFLPYNLPSARIFMGDTGSQFLGYAEGALGLWLLESPALPVGTGGLSGNPAMWDTAMVLSLLLCFSLPLSDLCFAVGRRILAGRSPFSADRGHLHHLLADAGFSRWAVLWLLCLPSFLLALTSILLSQ